MDIKKFKHQKVIQGMIKLPIAAAIVMTLFFINQGCQKMDSTSPSSTTSEEFKITDSTYMAVTNLVSDTTGYGANIIDSNLVNAWGLAINDEMEFWVSSTEEGLSTAYNENGATIHAPVKIPFGNDPNGGEPTGVVYNTTSSFTIPSTGETAELIFATENGTIAAWASGDSAFTVADRSADSAVYKGIEIANNNGADYIYATNFRNGTIDVFDATFTYVSSITFTDPDMPSGYAPFNIKMIDSFLYVTYAKQLGPDNEDDEAGPGNGFVDVYNINGAFVKRFTSQGNLNSPWGIAAVPGGGGLLIGNFGDGKINIFDWDGVWKGYLNSGAGNPIVIEGLWSIVFPVNEDGSVRHVLYFTAGPGDESHGLFGYIGKP